MREQEDLRELFSLGPEECVSDTLESFATAAASPEQDDEQDDGQDGEAAAAAAAAAAVPPNNPLSINPYDPCDGYKPQHGQPMEAKLLLHGHHHPNAFFSVNDQAMRESVGNDVSFIFSREVDGCDLSKFDK